MRIFFITSAVLLVAALLRTGHTAARDGAAMLGSSIAADPQQPATLGNRQSLPEVPAKRGTHRLREGTIVTDEVGYFRENGDGASFVADNGTDFGALQNLNLERVVRLLKNADEPNSIRWSVSGEVTEFSGRNYLLISRAVYKSAVPPPIPDQVAQ